MSSHNQERNQLIIRFNAVGIVMNLLLAAGKLIIGFMISSRAVMLDGLNSLSDMITSVVTMNSTLYAGKRSDREHPFGYGRLEYITSMFTTVFILTMGAYAIFDAVRELVSKI